MKELDFVNTKLTIVFITLFTIALGFGVILPVLPFYTERLAMGSGITPDTITIHVGFLTSVYPFFQMLFAPFWGRMSDSFNRRNLMIVGLIGFSIMQFLTGISSSLWMLYLARIIGGVFTSAVIPVSYALISDLTSDKTRTLGIALAGSSYSLGIVAGPFIGGLLSRSNLHLHLEIGHFLINDFSVPFFFLTVIGLGLFPIVSGIVKKTPPILNEKSLSSYSVGWHQIIWNLMPLLLLSFFYQIALTSFESVFSIYSKNELQYDAVTIGYGFMVCALVMGLLQPLVVSRKIKKLIPERNQIILGFGMFGTSIILLLFAKHLLFVLAFVGLLAIGGAFITPNIASIISLKGKEATGKAFGIQGSVNSLGQVIGPVAGSWLLTINHSLPYLITGTGTVLLTVIIFRSNTFLHVKV